jgi:glycosyltransferase involved in cell wall biosynthesis
VFYQAYDTTKYAFVYRRGFQKVRNSLPAYIHEVPARWQAGPLRRLVNESYAVRDWLGVRGARRLFTLSSQGQWELQQLYGVRAVIWTPGSAQASRIPPRDEGALRTLRHRYGVGEGQPVILSVNRLEYRKRIHVLIDSLRMLSTQGPRPKLVIVGDGEQRGALERQARDAGLSEQVEFAGLVSEASLAHHYHMCDVAVAIIWGSWALSIVEPLLYNKRLVISDEIPDLLQGVPNLFRAAPEPEAVARGLEQALSSVALNSGDVIRLQLDWDSQVDKLLAHVRAGVRGAASHS